MGAACARKHRFFCPFPCLSADRLVLLLGKQKNRSEAELGEANNKKQNEENPQLTTLAFSIRYCLKRSSIAIACKQKKMPGHRTSFFI
jgi:hypothetical protein